MSDTQITVKSPATDEVIGMVTIANTSEVAATVQRARVAQREWASRSLAERCSVLVSVKNVIIDRTDEICDLLSKEQGKPKIEAMVHEVINLVDLIHYFTNEASRILSPEPIPLHLLKHRSSYLHWAPRGVVGIIGPWNFPFNICNGAAVVALIAGNGVVIKPSEFTPLIQELAVDIFVEGGVPRDLFGVVHGFGETGAALVDQVDMIEFTGSVATGRKVAAQCGQRLIPCVTELGGKAAALVLSDANIERTANALAWGGFANCGQVCASVERVLVHRSVLPALLEQLVPKVAALKPGNTHADPTAQIGPLNNRRQRDIVSDRVEDAVAKGAKLLVGGHCIEGPGNFFEPTLLVDVTPEMDVMNLETFGPVLPIMVMDSEDDMIAEANRSHLGLLAYVFSRDTERARDIAERIESGTVMVNDVLATHSMPETPWGGVKASGVGHTHGDDSLRHMCQQRHVNYDLLPTMNREPYWYPYAPNLYGLFKRVMGGLLGTGFTQRLRWLFGR
jgi:succinate-semialdehyde dehydrogenase/glutarate-semialdehyde dehydrogenase